MSWGSSQVLKKSAAWLVWQSDRIPNNWGKIMTELERAKQQLQGEKRQMQVLLKWDGGQVFFRTGGCCNCMQCQVRADSIPTKVYASCWYILKAQWRLMICLISIVKFLDDHLITYPTIFVDKPWVFDGSFHFLVSYLSQEHDGGSVPTAFRKYDSCAQVVQADQQALQMKTRESTERERRMEERIQWLSCLSC